LIVVYFVDVDLG